MSDVKDISEWIKKIERGIWDSFGMASKEVMDAWAVFIVSRMRTNRQNPSPKPISIYTGRLARALQGGGESQDDGIVDDSVVVYERTVKVPYAAISEYGGKTRANNSTRRAMFAQLKKMGTYNKNTVWTHKAFFDHRDGSGMQFVKDSISEMSIDKIKPAIMRHIETELNKIPNLEVVIGGK